MLEEFKHSQQNEVFIGEIEHRNVYFGSEEDLALFNEIKAYREERPTEDMNKSAFGLFCTFLHTRNRKSLKSVNKRRPPQRRCHCQGRVPLASPRLCHQGGREGELQGQVHADSRAL